MSEALDIGLRAHIALGCRGISRADLRYDDTPEGDGRLYLLEVNTQPGMTPTSLVPTSPATPALALTNWLCGSSRTPHAGNEPPSAAAAPRLAAMAAPRSLLDRSSAGSRGRRLSRGADPSGA